MIFTYLELVNFKSYNEPVKIEWRQFSSIVGPNGAGKSTIVDAILFAFCIRPYDKMSIKNLKEDICNKSSNNPRSEVKVTLNFEDDEVVFQRIVDYNESAYKYSINGQDVKAKTYKNTLLKCNINCKANNFLVQQNSIENIAMKGPKERCEFFENLCGSAIYKEEYNNLKSQWEKVHSEAAELKKSLRFYCEQSKKLKKTSKELQEYEKLREKIKKIELDYYFAKLYKNDNTINKFVEEQNELRLNVKVTEKLKNETESNMEKLKDELKEQTEIIDKLSKDAEELQSEVSKYESQRIKISQELLCHKEKIHKIEENLKNRQKIHKKHKEIIKDLQLERKKVEEEKENFEKSLSLTSPLQLNDDQFTEYNDLKLQVAKRCAGEIDSCESIQRERDFIKIQIEDEERRKKENEQTQQQKQKYFESIDLKLHQLEEKVTEVREIYKKAQAHSNMLETEIEEVTKVKLQLTLDIEKLQNEIVENKEFEEEDKKYRQSKEVLNKLKSKFSGVHDRLINLCEPEDEIYEVAITKIMGNKMYNIVVDNTQTAKDCIEYISAEYAGNKFSVVETFLPINNLKTKTLNKVKQMIQTLPNTKLALDIMCVDSEDIRHVLHHILGDAVICETDNEASELSYSKRLNCVSLNGTYYRKDGSFSGGLASLVEKSKKWKKSKSEKQKQERENLKQEMHAKIDSLRKLEMELFKKKDEKYKLNLKIKGLEEKLKGIKEQEKELNNKKIKSPEAMKESDNIEVNLKIEKLRKSLNDKNADLERIEKQTNIIQDEVFASFCQKFNIDNIRHYEQGDFMKQKERNDYKKNFENHLDKINNQIEYEKSRDTKTIVKKLKNQLKELQEKYEKLLKEKSQLDEKIKKNKIGSNELSDLNKRKEIKNKIKQELKLAKIKYNAMEKDFKKLNSNIITADLSISNNQIEKNELLKECKMNDIQIPLRSKTIDKILFKNHLDSTTEYSENNSDDSVIREKDVEVDYSKLEKSVKTLEDNALDHHIQLLKNELDALQDQLKNFDSNYQSKKNLNLIQEKEACLKKDYRKKLEQLCNIQSQFDEVRNKRCTEFNHFFKPTEEKVNQIFKNLYENPTAEAHINIKNLDEPYLGGIYFSCKIPGKKYQSMENLSGGEKTMCAMALLLAIFRVKPAPFLVFDEIDAALDWTNICKISSYFKYLKSSTQIIVISHHDHLSTWADAIIGINISIKTNSSYAVHLDASEYQIETRTEKCLKARI